MSLSEPAALWCLPVALLVVVLFELRLDGPWVVRLARSVVRGTLLTLLVLALGGAHARSVVPVPPRLVLAVEHSTALEEAQDEIFAWVDRAAAAAQRKGLPVTVLRYGRTVGALSPWDATLRAQWGAPEFGRAQPGPAVYAATGAFGPDEAGGTLLIASGHGAHAGLADAVAAQRAQGHRVAAWAVPANARVVPPVPEVTALDAPPRPSRAFQVRAAVRTTEDGEAVLFVNGKEQQRAPVRGSDESEPEVAFDLQGLRPGLHRLAVTFEASNGASSAPRERDVHVVAPPYVVGLADPDAVVRRALEEMRVQAAWTTTAPEFDKQFAAAHPDANTPRRVDMVVGDAKLLGQLDVQTQVRLVQAVRDGLGLIVSVGKDKGAWNALGATPLAAVLPLQPLPEPKPKPKPKPPAPKPPTKKPDVDPLERDKGPGLKTQRRADEALPITWLFVIDKSKSMAPREGQLGGDDKFSMALLAAQRTAAKVGKSDRLGVMVFAEKPELVIKPSVHKQRNLRLWLSGVKPDGNSTNIFLALKQASKLMQEQPTPLKHIVLLTDGEQYPPGPIFSPVVIPMGRAGITLTCVGIGRGARMDQLRDIVRYAAGGLAIPAPTADDVPVIVMKDTLKKKAARDKEAEARGLLRDDEQEPERDPKPEKKDETPKEPERTPPKDPVPAAPTREPLRRVRGHEAVAGFDDGLLPDVGSPRRAKPRAGGQVLLVRRDNEPVLAAGRAGLGRVLAWTLPDDDAGIESWPHAAALLTQTVLAARTPQERFAYQPRLRVDQSDEGAVLDITWPPGATGRGFEVVWAGPDEPRSLGPVAPGLTTDRIALPAAPPGTLVQLRFLEDKREALPPRTYRVAARTARGTPAGDQAALDAIFGARPADVTQFVDTLPWGKREERRPLLPWLLWIALALLPFDVFLHRHRARQEP